MKRVIVQLGNCPKNHRKDDNILRQVSHKIQDNATCGLQQLESSKMC